MTKVVFLRSDGVFYGFREEGHAGYGEAGTDIVCAALSAMTMLIINTIEVSYASDVDYEIDDDDTRIVVTSRAALPEFEEDERKRYAVSGLFMSYFYQLNDMTEEYYKFLEVDVIDKDYA
jgi:uncharacterized protein YsxB (DUF464 family)